MYPKLSALTALILIFFALILARHSVAQGESPNQDPDGVVITDPVPGQAIQGIVPILGNTALTGFQSYELEFAYATDPTATWFLISEGMQPVANAEIAQWDTTLITDGDYTLRLTVRLEDGSQIVESVEGLRVRNYTAIETDTSSPADTTPTLVSPESDITPALTAVLATVFATPTATETAFIGDRDAPASLAYFTLIVIVAFSLAGILFIIRRSPKR